MTGGRVVLLGAVHESMAALHAIASHPQAELVCVVTLTPERAARTSGAVDLGGAASILGVDVMYVEDANHPQVVADIRAYAPELLVVVGWTRLIHDELLALPPRGCIGFHASLLPRHRGRAPVNWAILRGEAETGNTMMMLDRGADTGLIVDQRITTIGPEDTCASVYERIADLGALMLSDKLGALLNGTAMLREQEHGVADVLPKRIPEMGVTDWTRSAVELHNWVRALTAPYPGAFGYLGGRQVMLWSSRWPTGSEPAGVAGEVLQVTEDGLRVAAGSGSITVTRLGDPGGPAEDAYTWCRRIGVSTGARFALPSRELVAWSLGLGPRPVGSAR